jgi:DNA repair exonuclease SbcCD ATPase subunit
LFKDELARAEKQNEQIKKSIAEKQKQFESQIEEKKHSILYLKESIDQIRIKIDEVKSKENASQINEKIQIAILNKAKIEKEFDEKKQVIISDLRKNIDNIEDKKKEVDSQITKIREEISSLTTEYLEKGNKISGEFTEKIHELQKSQVLLQSKIDVATKKLDFYAKNTVCPECLSELTGSKKDKIVQSFENEKEETEKNLSNTNTEINELEAKRDEEINKIRKISAEKNLILEEKKLNLTEDFNSLTGKAGEIKKKIEDVQLNAFREELEKQIVEIDSFIQNQKEILQEIENVNKKIQFQEEEIKQKEKEIAVNLSTISSLEGQIEDVKKTQLIDTQIIEKKLTDERTQLSDFLKAEKKEKLIFDYFKIMENLTSDSGIKTQIIKHYLPILELKINEYLSLFQAEYTIELNEEFDVLIKFRHKEYIDYDNFSGGEKIRIDLALMFSFVSFLKMKTGAMTNLLFFDEILDSSLDMTGISALVQILKLLTQTGFTVMVVSHREENKSEDFEKVLEIKKEMFSEIKEM